MGCSIYSFASPEIILYPAAPKCSDKPADMIIPFVDAFLDPTTAMFFLSFNISILPFAIKTGGLSSTDFRRVGYNSLSSNIN